ncbi:putative hydrolase [Gordonia effusa NBRC 100432]|uniref:Putative hydrolase n=2 Tax=Gordonia effusa TaxID=263908 RepID=H0R110_9ACTN|nr:alpha/beta hydrolase [Gordonia effusa]GAB18761.1 putative hydrolase [Gordonia effusa NBRC 100432]
MPLAELPSGQIEYDVYGPEESAHQPVLFVHGVLVNGLLWREVAQRLAAAGYRSYVPTFPLGAHRLPVPTGNDVTPPAVAQLIREFVHAFNLNDATLVGNDTGGGLCQFALGVEPDLVGSVVLTNCDAFDKFPPQPFKFVFKLLKRKAVLRAAMPAMGATWLRHSWLGFGLLATKPDAALTAEMVQTVRSDPAIQADAAAVIAGIDALGDMSMATTRMSKVKVPVTILWGMADRCFTPALGRRLASTFPDATFVEVPGARTFVSLDAPQAVVDAVAAIGARTAR